MSTLYLHWIYTVSTLNLHYVYTVSTLYLHWIYTAPTPYLHCTYTIHLSTGIPPSPGWKQRHHKDTIPRLSVYVLERPRWLKEPHLSHTNPLLLGPPGRVSRLNIHLKLRHPHCLNYSDGCLFRDRSLSAEISSCRCLFLVFIYSVCF